MTYSQEVAASRVWALHGAEQPQIIVAGHSHAFAFVRGALHPPATARCLRAVAYSNPLDAGTPIGDDYWSFVVDAAVGRTVVILWNGNQHTVDFLFERTPPLHVVAFDEGYAGKESVPDDAVWASRAALRAHFAPSMNELDAILERLRDRAAAVVVAGTPAPKSTADVMSGLESDGFATALRAAATDGHAPRVARTGLRLTLWQIVQDLLAESAARGGAAFLPIPSATRAAEGTMLSAYSAPDVSHANPEYGDLVWVDIESHVLGGEAT